MGSKLATIRSIFGAKESKYNMLILGLPGAGKTTLLYKSLISDDKQMPPTLTDTVGFNQEMIIGKREFSCWDIGGSLIYGGEMDNDFFSTGNYFELSVFLNNIPLTGIIWVVNINQDINMMLRSKEMLHQIIEGYPQIHDILLVVVYNSFTSKKTTQNLNDDGEGGEIFIYKDIKDINSAW